MYVSNSFFGYAKWLNDVRSLFHLLAMGEKTEETTIEIETACSFGSGTTQMWLLYDQAAKKKDQRDVWWKRGKMNKKALNWVMEQVKFNFQMMSVSFMIRSQPHSAITYFDHVPFRFRLFLGPIFSFGLFLQFWHGARTQCSRFSLFSIFSFLHWVCSFNNSK